MDRLQNSVFFQMSITLTVVISVVNSLSLYLLFLRMTRNTSPPSLTFRTVCIGTCVVSQVATVGLFWFYSATLIRFLSLAGLGSVVAMGNLIPLGFDELRFRRFTTQGSKDHGHSASSIWLLYLLVAMCVLVGMVYPFALAVLLFRSW
jgi:hypothetical protein